ncbi:MAG: hypothetical protein AB1641_02825 [Thermodesulfobacteriota bacterium]
MVTGKRRSKKTRRGAKLRFTIICAWCGRVIGVKTAAGAAAGGPTVTHSICPACRKKVIGGLDDLLAANLPGGKPRAR